MKESVKERKKKEIDGIKKKLRTDTRKKKDYQKIK
jgi:hypothetical protein